MRKTLEPRILIDKISSMKLFYWFTVLGLCLALSLTGQSQAAVEESPFDNMDALISQSDIIVRGHVQRVRQKLRETLVRIGVDEVFKGDPDETSLVIRHGGGKHTIEPDEPSFRSYDQAILYLVRRGDFYRCLDGAEGKKTILNKNIYLHPDNTFVNMPVKKYVEKLSERLKTLYPEPEQI